MFETKIKLTDFNTDWISHYGRFDQHAAEFSYSIEVNIIRPFYLYRQFLFQ